MWLAVPFVILPIVEIALFIQVGGLIGLWPTIGLVLLSALVGSWLMRQQGLAALADLQGAFREFRDPTAPLAHGALILLAGALMVTPGFFTDGVGLALLVPAVRRWVIARIGRRMRVASAGFGFPGQGRATGRDGAPGRATVIEADYVVIDDDPPHPLRPGQQGGRGRVDGMGEPPRDAPPRDAPPRDAPPRGDRPRRPSGWTQG